MSLFGYMVFLKCLHYCNRFVLLQTGNYCKCFLPHHMQTVLMILLYQIFLQLSDKSSNLCLNFLQFSVTFLDIYRGFHRRLAVLLLDGNQATDFWVGPILPTVPCSPKAKESYTLLQKPCGSASDTM